MGSTKEQQLIISTAVRLYNEPETKTLTVAAIAGAGKTHTLIELTKAIKPTSGLYLAYNKAIQLEAAEKFKGTPIVCKTLHGLAYGSTVKVYGLSVKDFTYRDIEENLEYQNKVDLVAMLQSFLLSGSIDIHEYLAGKDVSQGAIDLLLGYYEKMLAGEVGGGHSLYLKLYHILLANGTIQPPKVDILLLDELGDITALTIEIFKLMKAKLKVAVGDSGQNIYSFTHTINGFKALEHDCEKLKLTQSFRVSSAIATRIESFARRTFDPKMEFKGNDMEIPTSYTSEAYIGRNNSELIGKMMDLNLKGIPFQTTRKPADIFGFILAVATLKPGKPIFDDRYKWLANIATLHQKLVLQGTAPHNILTYLAAKYEHDQVIMSAVSIINKIGASRLFDLYTIAKDFYADKNTYKITLTTAHSSKGLEFESVTIMNDLNMAIQKATGELALNPDPVLKEKILEEFRLYYVACSRAKFELNNAKYC